MFAIQVLKLSLAMCFSVFASPSCQVRVDRAIRVTMVPRYGLPMRIEKNDRRFIASEMEGQIHEMVTLPKR